MDELEAFLDDPSGAKALAKSPKKEPYIEDELSELINHPHTYIRRRVRQQVEDGLWLHDLNMFYSYLNDRENLRTATKNRCVVCTLPMGSCEHSLSWDNFHIIYATSKEYFHVIARMVSICMFYSHYFVDHMTFGRSCLIIVRILYLLNCIYSYIA